MLLSANPLENISNTTRIEGVSVGGKWIPRNELDQIVEIAIQKIGAGE